MRFASRNQFALEPHAVQIWSHDPQKQLQMRFVWERYLGLPFAGIPLVVHLVLEGRCKATWKRQFKHPWREAGPPNDLGGKVDSDQ